MVKIKKYGGINKLNPKENVSTSPEEDLEFLLWKEELYKELTAFWKAISK